MSDIEKLKPCPFCGESAASVHEHFTGNSYMVMCSNCTAEGPMVSTTTQAAIEWNRRSDGAAGTVEKDAARYRWLREHCYDTDPAGEGDAFDHPALHFESYELAPYDSSSLDLAVDAAIEAHNKAWKEQG